MESLLDQLAKDEEYQQRLINLGLLIPDSPKIHEAFELRIELNHLYPTYRKTLDSFRPYGRFNTIGNIVFNLTGTTSSRTIQLVNAYLNSALQQLGMDNTFPFFNRSKQGAGLRILGGQILTNPIETCIVSALPTKSSGQFVTYDQIITIINPQLDTQDPALRNQLRVHMTGLKNKLPLPQMLIRERDSKISLFALAV